MSTIQGVSGVSNLRAARELTTETIQRRIQIFKGDKIESPRSTEIDGRQVALPTRDPEAASNMAKVFGGLDGNGQAALVQAGHDLIQSLAEVSQADGAPDLATGSAGMEAMTDAAQTFKSTTGTEDANEALLGVMHVAVGSAEQDMLEFATTLEGNVAHKKFLREEIADLREQLGEWKPPQEGERTFYLTGPDGEEIEVRMTYGEANGRLEDLENQLKTAGDMTPMLQFDLQQALSKQQAAMQMLSTIMKNQHETLKALIQNMRV